MARFYQRFTIGLILVLLTSCARLDLVLGLAPRYITNKLDDAFDLSSKRGAKLRETISQDISQYKVFLLNELKNFLDKVLILSAKKELNQNDIFILFYEFKEIQKKTIEAFRPSFSEMILFLSRSELAAFNIYSSMKFKETNDMLINKNLYYKLYFKIYNRYVDILIDSSTDEQDQIFKTFLDFNKGYFEYQIEARKAFFKQFENLFDKKKELLELTLKYYSGEDQNRTKDNIRIQSEFYQNVVLLVLNIWKTSTDKQKLNFRKNITSFRNELMDLTKGVEVSP